MIHFHCENHEQRLEIVCKKFARKDVATLLNVVNDETSNTQTKTKEYSKKLNAMFDNRQSFYYIFENKKKWKNCLPF